MKTLNLLLCLLGLLASFAYSQTDLKQDKGDDLQKVALLSDVKILAIEIPKLDGSAGASSGQCRGSRLRHGRLIVTGPRVS